MELPADWNQSNVPPVHMQGEGEERGASTAAVQGAAATGTQRAGRPEPTVKAQGVFGTRHPADVAAR